ncbi:nitrous oxide reductase accessory protein NosL [Halomonas campisalis]|uniref:Nitrous oxide reductase accessory protein NosL n=1 Tax=Billgrantia campisalis TaxID=74661 RepID=A0ABS9P4Z2_9GAMM|nr:nitrous oxide reductase accessory protein NosL [Halomonas campisalis]MCG6656843.1 nitrous oxide reductase accessory protein NosL [Halomonas campisalis]MDR5862032.1 nitrous oxide reductase accessory protein NosL [Halomonas campisalis]
MIRLPITALALSTLLLAGCGDNDDVALAEAQPISDGDSCHVCGMLIEQLPGPKGQAFMDRDQSARKFCSTTDLFAFLLQPENERRISHAWVHDVGITPWSTPSDDAYILAAEAYYVVEHERRGAMGHTLASFSEQRVAEAFQETYGGRILTFEEIDLELLTELGRQDASMFPGGDRHDNGMPGH